MFVDLKKVLPLSPQIYKTEFLFNYSKMATRIRLQRFGRKGYPFYKIVIADSRAPRDGKFIERIGSYNPNTNPATIDLKFDRALYWLQTGAQPSDTVRTILSREGVCLKKHLLEGVKKGAFDEAAAETKFEAWLEEKRTSLQKEKDVEREKKKAKVKALLDAEKEVNKSKAEALKQKKAELVAAAEEKAKEEVAEEASATEEPATEVVEAASAEEKPVAEEPEAEEKPTEEAASTEEPKAEPEEKKAEKPAKEGKEE